MNVILLLPRIQKKAFLSYKLCDIIPHILIEMVEAIMNENKQTESFLDTDTIPTVEELTKLFQTNDFTTMQVYEESELTDDDKVGISYISDLYNKPWDKFAKEKGLKGHVSCYSKIIR